MMVLVFKLKGNLSTDHYKLLGSPVPEDHMDTTGQMVLVMVATSLATNILLAILIQLEKRKACACEEDSNFSIKTYLTVALLIIGFTVISLVVRSRWPSEEARIHLRLFALALFSWGLPAILVFQDDRARRATCNILRDYFKHVSLNVRRVKASLERMTALVDPAL